MENLLLISRRIQRAASSQLRSLDYFRTRPSSVDTVTLTVWGCTAIRRTRWTRDLLHQPITCQNPWKISKVRKKWSDLNFKWMEDVLLCLNLKEDIWLPYLKIVFSFLEIISSLKDMSIRESSDISSSDHDSDWVFSVSNQNKNPTKVLCALSKGPIQRRLNRCVAIGDLFSSKYWTLLQFTRCCQNRTLHYVSNSTYSSLIRKTFCSLSNIYFIIKVNHSIGQTEFLISDIKQH